MAAARRLPIPSSRRSPGTSSPLLDGARRRPERRRRRRCSPTPSARRRVRRAPRRQGRRARRRRARSTRCASSARSQELAGRAGSYAMLRFATDTADPARGALLQRVQEQGDGDRDDAAVLRARVGRARRRARRGAARHRRPRLLPPPPAHRAPLPPAPALRARGEDPRREGAHRPQRLDAAVRGAGVRDRGRARRTAPSRSRSRSRSRGCSRPTASVRRDAAERVTAALAPGLRTRAYVFNTLLADKMVDDRLRALPALARRAATSPTRRPTSRSQALIDAVRARYELPRRWYRLKAQLLGHRPARRLRPHGARSPHEDEHVAVDRGARPRARRPTRRSRPSSATLVERFFDERWIDAPVRPGKRGGAFCAYTVPSRAPVRAAQLHLAGAATC